jgi:hypothetical protein
MKLSFLFIFLVLFSSIGHSAAVDKSLKLSASDVSLLLPLPDLEKKRLDFRIPFEEAGSQGVVFSKNNFKKLPLVSSVFTDLDEAYKNSFIVGIRLDSPNNLIRLIGQTLRVSGGETQAIDFGLHLIYLAPTTEAIVAELQAIKKEALALGISTDGVALGIHPLFRGDYWKEPAKRALAEKMRAFVLRLAGEKTQVAASIMVTHEDSDPVRWEWARVAFDPASKKVLAKGDPGFEAASKATLITNVEGVHASHVFEASLGEREGKIIGRSKEVPELEKLLQSKIPSPTEEPMAYDSAYRIENPKLLAIPQADCVSCHVSTSYRLSAEAVWGAPKSLKSAYQPPVGISNEVEASIRDFMTKNLYVVLNFGYLGTEPSISQRTANETSEVLAVIESRFF